jgi:hypothetical protein
VFTYQKSIEPGGTKTADIGGIKNSAFTDFQNAGRNSRGQLDRGIERNLKSPEIAVIDADNFRARMERPFEFLRIVRLNQRGETVLGGEFAEIAEFVLFEDRDNEENRIRTGCGRFEDVVLRDGEIFPQDGESAGGAGGAKIVQAPLEEIAVGQDGERRCSAVFVLLCERYRVEIVDEHSLAGGCLFDFRDDGRVSGAEGGGEIATVMSRLFSILTELGDRNRGFAQLFSFAGCNPGQDVGCSGNQYLMLSQHKELFQLADQARERGACGVYYRGVVFQVVPEKKTSKLNKLVGQPVVAANVDLEQASKELSAEMETAWLENWSDL